LYAWLGRKLYARTKTILNGARIYNFKPRNNVSEPIRFVSVGSLFEKKGFETSLTALSQLKNIDWTYALVGDGPLRHQLEDLTVKLGIADRVVFSGWSNQIEAHLHDADIQLIPSLWEGFGLVAVEGMSTGLPIIASNVDGLREVLGLDNPAVFLVDNYTDPSCWVEKIVLCIQLLKHDSIKMSSTAREQAEIFTLDKMVENYVAVYKDLF
jgi:glycosyltransferase involved in cell wall biosynthesis